MRIGAGIALIAAGAIIAFAVRDTSDTLNLTALGIIIMLGGAAGIWLSYRLANRRHGHDEVVVIDPEVEKQYNTTPPDRVAEHPIDVTPTHLRDDSANHRGTRN
ncbi:hypothetical protein E0H75_16900 [Kribbella capetownensis]|uniref:Uncharacterized protein n=1 Tax=Kribbella capetownensis TaxID=1572659 RepID=A0A4R0JTV0_9ACTN|nr:hypothetical protein [Kribbella capetownensis]TCC49977.1 hypothetical protein E0H75_16900 [Kribbella capetownensis]